MTYTVRVYENNSQVASWTQETQPDQRATFTKADMDRAYATGREAGLRAAQDLAYAAHHNLTEAIQNAQKAG